MKLLYSRTTKLYTELLCSLTLSLRGGGWTCTNILRAVLSTCAQCCPCEALEQKKAQIPKPKRKEIELSSYQQNGVLAHFWQIIGHFG